MKISYTTKGTCSRSIDFEIDGDHISNVTFHGGCKGYSQGLAALVEGMSAEEVVSRLKGIDCRNNTSCPDQLAQAIEQNITKQYGEKSGMAESVRQQDPITIPLMSALQSE